MSDQWYYGEDGQQRGPVSIDALRQRMAAGQLRDDDLVWREGMPNWVAAQTIPELRGAAPNPPPGPPGYPPTQPQHYAGTAQPQYGYYDPQVARLSGSATTAMWFGIVSLVGAFCCAPVGIGFGIAAIVKGRNARFAPNSGNATAGVVCGAIGLALALLNLLGTFAVLPELMRQQRMNGTQTMVVAPAGGR